MLKYYQKIIEAYENEIDLDKDYITTNNIDLIFNFKPIKLIAFKKKLKIFFYPTLIAYFIFFPLFSLLQIILILTYKIIISEKKIDDILLIPTNKYRVKTLKKILSKNTELDISYITLYRMNHIFVYGNLLNFINFLKNYLYFLVYIFYSKKNFFDMYLHSYDVISLLYLTEIMTTKNCLLITDDHYQRWSYIISKVSNKNIYIQHGYIKNYFFTNQYGTIDKLLYTNKSDLSTFKNCFNIKEYFKVSSSHIFKTIERINQKKVIFFASSYPFVRDEIDFLQLLQTHNESFYIIIKLHPNHIYDLKSKQILMNLTDIEWLEDYFPITDFFISYKSFLSEAYNDNNVITYSIVDYTNINDIIKLLTDA